MIATFLGLFGVLVGVFLSQVFTIAHESRARRLDALAALVAASGRMIGAYERLFELFEGGTSPPLDEDRVVAVTPNASLPTLSGEKPRRGLRFSLPMTLICMPL